MAGSNEQVCVSPMVLLWMWLGKHYHKSYHCNAIPPFRELFECPSHWIIMKSYMNAKWAPLNLRLIFKQKSLGVNSEWLLAIPYFEKKKFSQPWRTSNWIWRPNSSRFQKKPSTRVCCMFKQYCHYNFIFPCNEEHVPFVSINLQQKCGFYDQYLMSSYFSTTLYSTFGLKCIFHGISGVLVMLIMQLFRLEVSVLLFLRVMHGVM